LAVKTIWLQGLDNDQAEAVKQTLTGNSLFITQLIKILQARYESIERKGFNEEDYKTPDWTHLQAFQNGKLSELLFIRELFDNKKD
jgi:hypothetical protein